ncbi:MAG TPA: hypothetical protein VLK82_10515 [Candidatus Tectomicrobia bacterium]|nr:hypothetical protein [Candidatus Tectomicrobia bacterium]
MHLFAALPPDQQAIRAGCVHRYGDVHSLRASRHRAIYDQPTRNIINGTFLAGTLRNVGGTWVFYDMSARPATPLSLDRYYA